MAASFGGRTQLRMSLFSRTRKKMATISMTRNTQSLLWDERELRQSRGQIGLSSFPPPPLNTPQDLALPAWASRCLRPLSPQVNSPQPRSDLAPPCRHLLILQPGQTGTCIGVCERTRCRGSEPSLVPTQLSAPMSQHRADPSLPKAHHALPAARPPSPAAAMALSPLPAPPSTC